MVYIFIYIKRTCFGCARDDRRQRVVWFVGRKCVFSFASHRYFIVRFVIMPHCCRRVARMIGFLTCVHFAKIIHTYTRTPITFELSCASRGKNQKPYGFTRVTLPRRRCSSRSRSRFGPRPGPADSRRGRATNEKPCPGRGCVAVYYRVLSGRRRISDDSVKKTTRASHLEPALCTYVRICVVFAILIRGLGFKCTSILYSGIVFKNVFPVSSVRVIFKRYFRRPLFIFLNCAVY